MGAIDGLYQNAIPTITLRASSPTADVSATFRHEYNHCLWLKALSSSQRVRHVSVYDRQRRDHHLGSVYAAISAYAAISVYAAISAEEGFAEAFSLSIQEHDHLAQCDPLSCCFLSVPSALASHSGTTSSIMSGTLACDSLTTFLEKKSARRRRCYPATNAAARWPQPPMQRHVGPSLASNIPPAITPALIEANASKNIQPIVRTSSYSRPMLDQ